MAAVRCFGDCREGELSAAWGDALSGRTYIIHNVTERVCGSEQAPPDYLDYFASNGDPWASVPVLLFTCLHGHSFSCSTGKLCILASFVCDRCFSGGLH